MIIPKMGIKVNLFLLAFATCMSFSEQQSTPTPYIPPQGGNWWTAFGGDDAHTGYKPDKIGPTIIVNQQWAISASTYLTAAVVHDGIVYVVSPCSFSSGILYAYEETTGDLINQLNFGECANAGPPTIGQDGRLYIQTTGSNEGIYLYAIAMETMIVEWVAKGSTQWSPYPYGVASSDTTGLVYFAGGAYNGVMYAVDATNGTRVFASSLYSTGFGCDTWAPTVYTDITSIHEDTRVFFSTQTGEGNNAMCGEVDAITGEVKWRKELNAYWSGYSTYWVPVIADKTLFAANSTYYHASIVAINIDNQAVLWKTDECDTVYGSDVSPATDGNTVFLTCNGMVKEFNALTGTLVAQYSPCSDCYGQPIVTDDYIIVSSNDAVLIFERARQQIVGTIPVDNGNIAYHGGWIFVSSEKTLSAYQLITDL